MGEKFEADCQYNDYLGSVAIDEPLPELGQRDLLEEMASRANLPSDYLPVGFGLAGACVDEQLQPTRVISITLVAVREDEAGAGLDQIIEYGRSHGTIPVYRFPLEMDIVELLSFFQRLMVTVLVRGLKNHPVEVVG